MVKLQRFDQAIDEFFHFRKIGVDPAFSRFIPMVYDSIHYPWKEQFEPEFKQLFNGLMIRGEEEVGRVFLAVFPTDEILSRFINEGSTGDVLFMHHPIVMECGDPRGEWGRGFIPIPRSYIAQIKEKGLSVFTLHVPLDYSRKISTSDAIAEAFHAKVVSEFFGEKNELCGVICEIAPTSTNELIKQAKEIFSIPYADVHGPEHTNVTKIAIVAGCGDKVIGMKEAEDLGAQVYLTGEVHCHIDNDYGRKRYAEMKTYIKETKMSLIGVSHGASEYLVHATQLKRWFNEELNLPVTLLPQKKWWI